MSKVITFSRVFPKGHPRVGEPTFFVEKIWSSIHVDADIKIPVKNILLIADRISFGPKHHTIRSSNRWKVGDKFSPRVWSGKPYQSKQIIIGPDIEIKKIWKFEMDEEGLFYINGKWVDVTSSIHDGKTVADNDGLDADDFMNWFGVHPKKKYKKFSGQILCWNESIEYYE